MPETGGIDSALVELATIARQVRGGDEEPSVPPEAPPLEVVVCGEYGRGKSSLLSAIAGRRRLLPHAVNDSTSIATTVVWGEQDEAFVTFEPDPADAPAKPRRMAVPLSEVHRYVTEGANRGNRDRVTLVEIRAALPNLAHGIKLIDTPGVNSRHEAHNMTTRAYLDRADTILFVASADGPLSTLELDAIGAAASGGADIVAVLAKSDQAGAPELRESAAERLSERLGRPIEVLPVSAVMEFEGIEEHLPALRADSGIPELLARLQELVVGHRARFAGGFVVALRRRIAERRDVALDEQQTLEEAERRTDALERRLEQARSDLAALDEAERQVHAAIDDEVARGMASIRDSNSTHCEALAMRVEADQANLDPAIGPSEYQRTFFDQLARIAEEADQSRAQLVGRIVAAAEKVGHVEVDRAPQAENLRSGLGLETIELKSAEKSRLTLEAFKKGLAEGPKVAAPAGSVGGLIGGIIGAAPGAAAGLVVGGLVGHVIGWLSGTVEATREEARKARADQVKALAKDAPDWIARIHRRIDEQLENITTATAGYARAEAAEIIGRRRRGLVDYIERSERDREHSPGDRRERSAQLRAELADLDRLERSLDTVAARLERLDPHARQPRG